MGKSKSFADKMQKGAQDFTTHCKTCGESYSTIKVVSSEKSKKTDAWRFNQKFVSLCKCNENEITA